MKYTYFISQLAHMKPLIQGIVMSLIVILVSSCSLIPEDQSLDFEIYAKYNGNEITYSNLYNINGKTVRFSLVQFYISGLLLLDDTGASDAFPASGLVKPGTNRFLSGNITLKNISSIKFTLGLDSMTNHANPLQYWVNDPLAIQTPSMYWNQERGYIFLNLKGMVDNDGDGTPETPFSYEVGSDTNARLVSLPLAIVVKNQFKNDLVRICAEADVAAFLSGIDFSQQLTTQTTDNPVLAAQIARNIPAAFAATPCP